MVKFTVTSGKAERSRVRSPKDCERLFLPEKIHVVMDRLGLGVWGAPFEAQVKEPAPVQERTGVCMLKV